MDENENLRQILDSDRPPWATGHTCEWQRHTCRRVIIAHAREMHVAMLEIWPPALRFQALMHRIPGAKLAFSIAQDSLKIDV